MPMSTPEMRIDVPSRSNSSQINLLFALALVWLVWPAAAQTTIQRLKSFGDPSASGTYPIGELVRGSDGALYGTTTSGGLNGVGVVFKINTNGAGYNVLHHFNFAPDGWNPAAGLILGSDGVLYGTTD